MNSIGQPMVSSLLVADKFGKRHDNVLQAIEKLECSKRFRLLNFKESSYLTSQGKEQPMFQMTRDGFSFLAMGFTGKEAAAWKERFIEAFNAMEGQSGILNVLKSLEGSILSPPLT